MRALGAIAFLVLATGALAEPRAPELTAFQRREAGYRAEVARATAITPARPLVLGWRWEPPTGPGVPVSLSYLVYDESDQLTLSPPARSPAWWRSAAALERLGLHRALNQAPNSDDHRHTVAVERLTDHFFLLTESDND